MLWSLLLTDSFALARGFLLSEAQANGSHKVFFSHLPLLCFVSSSPILLRKPSHLWMHLIQAQMEKSNVFNWACAGCTAVYLRSKGSNIPNKYWLCYKIHHYFFRSHTLWCYGHPVIYFHVYPIYTLKIECCYIYKL